MQSFPVGRYSTAALWEVYRHLCHTHVYMHDHRYVSAGGGQILCWDIFLIHFSPYLIYFFYLHMYVCLRVCHMCGEAERQHQIP